MSYFSNEERLTSWPLLSYKNAFSKAIKSIVMLNNGKA
jgi:hypothetical protein